MISYSHPDSLIETQWLTAHLNDSSVRIVSAGQSVPDCVERGGVGSCHRFDLQGVAILLQGARSRFMRASYRYPLQSDRPLSLTT